MPFACPYCTATRLEIIAGMELPADSRSDEISLQVVECSACGFSALAIYQESRRGALDSEVWEHAGYRVMAADLLSVYNEIKSCPQANDPACTCPAHRHISRKDAHGTWNGLNGIQIIETFDLQWH